MRFLVFFAMLFMFGCGVEGINKHDNKLALSTYTGYVELFQYEASTRGVSLDIDNLVIQTADIEQKSKTELVLAYCQLGDTPTITVDPKMWTTLDFIDQQLLIFHESGHCLLGRAHVTDGTTSIMNPMILASQTFESNQKALLDELFDQDKFNTMAPGVFH